MQSYYRLWPTHGNTYAVLLIRTGSTHRHLHKTPKKKESRDFPERVVQPCALDLDSELPRCGPRARTSRLHVWPLNATNGVSGTISARIRGRGNCLCSGSKGGWWMLRPAGVVSGLRADHLGTDRRLVPPDRSSWRNA